MTLVTVTWQGINLTQCDVVHVLVLSRLAPSNRAAKVWVKSGWVFLNGTQVPSLRSLMNLNEIYTVEVRFPSGIKKSMDLIVKERMYL